MTMHRRLALLAVTGPILFTLTWLVLGLLSPGYTLFDHTFTDYDPVSQPISGLGMGVTAPYMNTAFVVTGLMLVVGVVAAMRTTGRPPTLVTVLLACTGVGQVVCGLFDLEAVLPHLSGFLLALGVPVVSFLLVGRYLRSIPRWRRFGSWLMLGSPATAVLLALFFATFQPTADGAEHGVGGLVQRAAIVEVLAWFVALGWLASRRTSPDLPVGQGFGADSGQVPMAATGVPADA